MPLPSHGKNVLYCHDQQSRCLGSYAHMSLDRSSQGLHTTARCSLRLHNRCKYSVIWLVKHDVCQKLLNTDRKSLHWPARIAEQTTGMLSLRAHRPHVVFERGYQFYLTFFSCFVSRCLIFLIVSRSAACVVYVCVQILWMEQTVKSSSNSSIIKTSYFR